MIDYEKIAGWPAESIPVDVMNYVGDPLLSNVEYTFSLQNEDGEEQKYSFTSDKYSWEVQEDTDNSTYTLSLIGDAISGYDKSHCILTTDFDKDGNPINQTIEIDGELHLIDMDLFEAEDPVDDPVDMSSVADISELVHDDNYIQREYNNWWSNDAVPLDINAYSDDFGEMPPLKWTQPDGSTVLFTYYTWEGAQDAWSKLTLTGDDDMGRSYTVETSFYKGIPDRQVFFLDTSSLVTDTGSLSERLVDTGRMNDYKIEEAMSAAEDSPVVKEEQPPTTEPPVTKADVAPELPPGINNTETSPEQTGPPVVTPAEESEIVVEPYTTEMADNDAKFALLDKGFIPAPFLADECFAGGKNPLAFGDGVSLYSREDIERVRNSSPDGRTAYFGSPLGFDMSKGAEVFKVEFSEISKLFEKPQEFADKFDTENLYFVKYTDSDMNQPINGKYEAKDPATGETKTNIIENGFKMFNICTLYAYPKEQGNPESIQDKVALPNIMTLVTNSAGKVSHAIGFTRSDSIRDVTQNTTDFAEIRVNPDIFIKDNITIDKLADRGVPTTAEPEHGISDFKAIKEPFIKMVTDMLPSIVARADMMDARTLEARDDYSLKHEAAKSMDIQTFSARESFKYAVQSYDGTLASYANICRSADNLRSAVAAASIDGNVETVQDVKESSNAAFSTFTGLLDESGSIHRFLDEVCGKGAPGQPPAYDKPGRMENLFEKAEKVGASSVFDLVVKFSELLIEGSNGSLPSGALTINEESVVKDSLTKEIGNAVRVANCGGLYKDTGFTVTEEGTRGNGEWIKEDGVVEVLREHPDTYAERFSISEDGHVYDTDCGVEIVPRDILDSYAKIERYGVDSNGDEIRKSSFMDLTNDQKCTLLYKHFVSESARADGKTDVPYKEFRHDMLSSPLTNYEYLAKLSRSDCLTSEKPGFHLVRDNDKVKMVSHRAFDVCVIGIGRLDDYARKGSYSKDKFSALTPTEKCDILFNNVLSKSEIDKIVTRRTDQRITEMEAHAEPLSKEEKEQVAKDIRNELAAEFKGRMCETTLESYERSFENIFDRVTKWAVTEDVAIDKKSDFHADFTVKSGRSSKDISVDFKDGEVSGTVKLDGGAERKLTSLDELKDEIGSRSALYNVSVIYNGEDIEFKGKEKSNLFKDFVLNKESLVIGRYLRHEMSPVSPQEANKDIECVRGKFVKDYSSYVENQTANIDVKDKDFIGRVFAGDDAVDVSDERQIKSAFGTVDDEEPQIDNEKPEDVTNDSHDSHDSAVESQARSDILDEAGNVYTIAYGRLNKYVELTPDGMELKRSNPSDPKDKAVDVRISRYKLNEIRDKIDEIAKKEGLSEGEKSDLYKKEVDALKEKLRGYVVDAKQWEVTMQRMDLPRVTTGSHYGYQFAKLQHTYAIFAYCEAGGAVGENEAVTQKVGSVALYNARHDVVRTNPLTTYFINKMAFRDATTKAERYVNDNIDSIKHEAETEVRGRYSVSGGNGNSLLVNGEIISKEAFEEKIAKEIEKATEEKKANIKESIIDRDRFEGVLSTPKYYTDAYGEKHKMSVYDRTNMSYRMIAAGICLVPAFLFPTCGVVLAIGVLGEYAKVRYEYHKEKQIVSKIERDVDIRIESPRHGTARDGIEGGIPFDIIGRFKDIANAITRGLGGAVADEKDSTVKDEKDDTANDESKEHVDKEEHDTATEDETPKSEVADDEEEHDTAAKDETPKSEVADDEEEHDTAAKDETPKSEVADDEEEHDTATKDETPKSEVADDEEKHDTATKDETPKSEVADDEEEHDTATKDETPKSEVADDEEKHDTAAKDETPKSEVADDEEEHDTATEDETPKSEVADDEEEHDTVTEDETPEAITSDDEGNEGAVTEEEASDSEVVNDEEDESSVAEDVALGEDVEKSKENSPVDEEGVRSGAVVAPDHDSERDSADKPEHDEKDRLTGEKDDAKVVENEPSDENGDGRDNSVTKILDGEEALVGREDANMSDAERITTASNIDTSDDNKIDVVAVDSPVEHHTGEANIGEVIQNSFDNIIEAVKSCFSDTSATPISNFEEAIASEKDILSGAGVDVIPNETLSEICGTIKDIIASEIPIGTGVDSDGHNANETCTLVADMVVSMANEFFGSTNLESLYGTDIIMGFFDDTTKDFLDPYVQDAIGMSMLDEFEIETQMGDFHIVYDADTNNVFLSDIDGNEMSAIIGSLEMTDISNDNIDVLKSSIDVAATAADMVTTDALADNVVPDMNDIDKNTLFSAILNDAMQNNGQTTAEEYRDFFNDNPSALFNVISSDFSGNLSDLMQDNVDNGVTLPEDTNVAQPMDVVNDDTDMAHGVDADGDFMDDVARADTDSLAAEDASKTIDMEDNIPELENGLPEDRLEALEIPDYVPESDEDYNSPTYDYEEDSVAPEYFYTDEREVTDD